MCNIHLTRVQMYIAHLRRYNPLFTKLIHNYFACIFVLAVTRGSKVSRKLLDCLDRTDIDALLWVYLIENNIQSRIAGFVNHFRDLVGNLDYDYWYRLTAKDIA